MLIEEGDDDEMDEEVDAEEEEEETELLLVPAHTSSPAPMMESVSRNAPCGDHGGGSGRMDAGDINPVPDQTSSKKQAVNTWIGEQ
jgi:hypothetical protein